MKNIVSCNIRVEEADWEKLRLIAEINKRSINKEIEFIIAQRIIEYYEILKDMEKSKDENSDENKNTVSAK